MQAAQIVILTKSARKGAIMQMSAISAAGLFRRIRIRSWKDLVAMLIAGGVYYGLY